MKNGLINENGKLIYYKDGHPFHAGVVQIDGTIYYIGKNGIAITGKHTVHSAMTNGILTHGVYTFASDGKLIEGSYVPLKTGKHKRKHSSKKRTKKEKKHLSKQTKKRIWIICGLLLLAALFLFLTLALDNLWRYSGNNKQPDTTTAAPSDIKIDLPEFKEEVQLVSDGMLAAYRGELSIWEARAYGTPYRPLVFEYNLYGKNGVLFYSENADLSDALQIELLGSEKSVKIHNLKTGIQYYYAVIVEGKSFQGSFKTAASTRFISVDGLYNSRDIGGYTTLDGKTVKQGMIIRGTEIDGLVEASYRLSVENLSYMADTFGFVYDMDLRAQDIFPGKYSSYLGKDVKHSFYTSPAYGSIFDANFSKNLKRIFTDLAKEENYPMYMHCTYGADRTGTIVFLLQAILNMSEEQMIREYQTTGFVNSSFASSNQCDVIIAGLSEKEGTTLQEKAVSFLINDIGITEEQIESIRSILLEP